jgi:hypothetical protein
MPPLPPPQIPGLSSPPTADGLLVAQLQARVAALESRLIALERIIAPIPGGGVQITAQGDLKLQASNSCTLTVAKNLDIKVGGEMTQRCAHDLQVIVSKHLTLDGVDSATLKSGSAFLQLKKSGDAMLSGNRIDIKGSGEVTVKSASTMALKGSKILQN